MRELTLKDKYKALKYMEERLYSSSLYLYLCFLITDFTWILNPTKYKTFDFADNPEIFPELQKIILEHTPNGMKAIYWKDNTSYIDKKIAKKMKNNHHAAYRLTIIKELKKRLDKC